MLTKAVSAPLFSASLSLFFLTLSGCGGADLPELGRVSGSVTLNGVPIDDAQLEFMPIAGGRPSSGITDSEGNYELYYVMGVKGAIPGKHTVRITSARIGSGFEGDGPVVEARPETIPEEYNTNTSLEVEVLQGSIEHHFVLEGERGASSNDGRSQDPAMYE